MSKDEFIIHEWQKDKMDALVKHNELEGAKKEGRLEGIKEKELEIAKNMLKEKIGENVISRVTGLTEEDIKKLIKDDTKK